MPEERIAVFLDRDGTIIEDVNYCLSPDDVRLLPGAAAAISRLNAAGMTVVVVTNQSAIGRGMLSERELEAIHRRMSDELHAAGASIDAIYHCPHHPNVDCQCRKPAPGMLHQAASDLSIDLSSSFLIGDQPRDIQAGHAAGCSAVLINRESRETTTLPSTSEFWTAGDLWDAASLILNPGLRKSRH